MAGGLAAASFARTTWHLYLTQGALVGLGTGLVYVPSMAILSQWFLKRRSLYVYFKDNLPIASSNWVKDKPGYRAMCCSCCQNAAMLTPKYT